jgi:hypothetical protein
MENECCVRKRVGAEERVWVVEAKSRRHVVR